MEEAIAVSYTIPVIGTLVPSGDTSGTTDPSWAKIS
jgi:hypothetical protein